LIELSNKYLLKKYNIEVEVNRYSSKNHFDIKLITSNINIEDNLNYTVDKIYNEILNELEDVISKEKNIKKIYIIDIIGQLVDDDCCNPSFGLILKCSYETEKDDKTELTINTLFDLAEERYKEEKQRKILIDKTIEKCRRSVNYDFKYSQDEMDDFYLIIRKNVLDINKEEIDDLIDVIYSNEYFGNITI
jgi:hypothetical protein